MRKVLILFLCLWLGGCTTGYHKRSWTGGYSDIQIQDDIFKITFDGNTNTGSDRAENFALLRSAEVALENGYKYFIIIESRTKTQPEAYTIPAITQTAGSVEGETFQRTTTVSGGQTYVYQNPGVAYTIKCFKDKPQDSSTLVYDAQQVRANLKRQYNLF